MLSRGTIAAALAAAALAAWGLPRLTVDGAAAFALPEGDPLIALNAQLDAATGGDDLLAVVVWPDSPYAGEGLDPALVETTAAVADALDGLPSLRRVADPLSAPLVAEVDGALTAVRPFDPRPEPGSEAWAAASAALTADPFVGGQLVAEDGSLMAVLAWIERGGADDRLVRIARRSLRDEPVQGLKALVDGAALAVALGEAQGPVDAAIAARLREAAAGQGKAAGDAEIASAWIAEATAAAADPEGAAVAEVRAAVEGLPPHDGVRTVVLGAPVVEETLAAVVPVAVQKAMTALLLLTMLMVAWQRRDTKATFLAGAAPVVACGLAFGAFGAMGIPLMVPVALAALVGAAWAAWQVAAAGAGGLAPAGAHVLMAGAALAWGWGLKDAGAATAPLLGVLAGSIAGGLLAPFVEPSATDPKVTAAARGGGERRPWKWLPFAAALLVLGGVHLARDLPVGLDAGGLVAWSHPAGAASAALASTTGTSPAAFLVYRDEARPRAAASPQALRALRMAQEALRVQPAVRGTASWADFVARLHAIMSGARRGALPDEAALIDQYLLAFGNAGELAALRSPDLTTATGVVRLNRQGGAALGVLAEDWPAGAGPVALAGDAVAISKAGRTSASRMLCAGAGAWVLAALLLLGLPGTTTPRQALAEALFVGGIAAAIAVVAGVGIAGAITPSVAGAALMGAAFVAAGRSLNATAVFTSSVVLLGLFPAGPVGSTQIASFVAGIAVAAILATVVRAFEP